MERHGLWSHYQRLLKLEAQHPTQGKQLSEGQIKSIEKATPCFKERQWRAKLPATCFAKTPSMQVNSEK